jgi:hypothetical protein
MIPICDDQETTTPRTCPGYARPAAGPGGELPVLPGRASRSMRVPLYPPDMSDAEWAITEATLPEPAWQQGRGGRPAKLCRRDIVDAIRYLVKEGIQWRAMLADLPLAHRL